MAKARLAATIAISLWRGVGAEPQAQIADDSSESWSVQDEPDSPVCVNVGAILILVKMAQSAHHLFRPDFASFRSTYIQYASLHLASSEQKI